KTTFALDYFALSFGDAQNAEWIGNEVDLMVKHAVNDYVELHAGIAYVFEIHENSNPYAGQLGMIVRF
ncbi:MAG: hypothetical protein LBR90_04400, partial [Elusimicrobiota bacterium]|nr:hypothetical protein [Elusimicrobiota bacterium]